MNQVTSVDTTHQSAGLGNRVQLQLSGSKFIADHALASRHSVEHIFLENTQSIRKLATFSFILLNEKKNYINLIILRSILWQVTRLQG